MKTFKHKITGIIEHVTNPVLVEQYEKHADVYEEIVANEPTLKELKEQADALGIEYKPNVSKNKLLELIKSVK
jgi:hypothetical protein